MKTSLSLALLLIFSASAQARQSWGPATWVWDEPEANSQPQNDEPRFFRRKFALAAEPLKAELWVTADNEHTSYVNGKKLGRGTEWSKVDKYDVLPNCSPKATTSSPSAPKTTAASPA